jgi:hypothetical protein
MVSTPSSGPPGTPISATSVTPCPAGSTYATIYLNNGTGTAVASAHATAFDFAGNWMGKVTVPASALAGSNYLVTASCFEPATRGGASDLENYNSSPFAVTNPMPPPPGAPSLSRLGISPHQLSIAGRVVNGRCVKPTKKNHADKRCPLAIKLHVNYTLNTAATVTLRLKRKAPGRNVNGRCVKPTNKNKQHKRCTRLVSLHGSITLTGHTGPNSFTFNGKLGGHTLGPGSYQLTATPTANGQAGTPQTTTLKILP